MMTASGGLQPSRRGGRAPPVEIIIYGRGALSELKVSLRSLKALDYRAPLKITLAFDASADGIKRRLADLAEKESLELHQEEEPGRLRSHYQWGSRATSAQRIHRSDGRRVTVPPRWLDHLIEPARANADVGLVGPMSNFAAWQSLPKTMTPIGKWPFNRLPKGMKLADFEQLLEEFWNDDPIWPLVPLLDGFCLAIRESVFERIDLLDEQLDWTSGGDVDFCFRASGAGFGLVVASDTAAYRNAMPRGDAAASDRKARLPDLLVSRYDRDRLDRASQTLQNNPILQRLRDRVAEIAARERKFPHQRIERTTAER